MNITAMKMPSEPLVETNHQSLSMYLNRAQKAISELYPRPEKVVAEIASIKFNNKNAFIELAEYDNNKNRTLKAKVQAIIFRSKNRIITDFEKQVKRKLETGMKVLVDVKTTLTEQRGLSVEIVGIDHKYTVGDMALLVEEIRKTLIDQNLFSRNKDLTEPKDFFNLAIIAPASSAGLEDFKKKLEDIPEQVCKKIERTCLFQSDKAGDEIAREINTLNNQYETLDAILIIRGGGAKSDLNYLNHLNLAKAVCSSKSPIFVGVGHQTDRTILDEIACREFPTPSLVASFIRERIKDRMTEMFNYWEFINADAKRRVNEKEAKYEKGWLRFAQRVDASRMVQEQLIEENFRLIHNSTKENLLSASNKLELTLSRVSSLANDSLLNEETRTKDHRNTITQSVRNIVSQKDYESQDNISSIRKDAVLYLQGIENSATTSIVNVKKDSSAAILSISSELDEIDIALGSETKRCLSICENELSKEFSSFINSSLVATHNLDNDCSQALNQVTNEASSRLYVLENSTDRVLESVVSISNSHVAKLDNWVDREWNLGKSSAERQIDKIDVHLDQTIDTLFNVSEASKKAIEDRKENKKKLTMVVVSFAFIIAALMALILTLI